MVKCAGIRQSGVAEERTECFVAEPVWLRKAHPYLAGSVVAGTATGTVLALTATLFYIL
jgi:hypothetical protein